MPVRNAESNPRVIRKGFISPPYGCAESAHPTWEVYAEVTWASSWAASCHWPPVSLVAACTTHEAAIAAARLLGISLEGRFWRPG